MKNKNVGYVYDLRDNWEHNVIVGKIFDKSLEKIQKILYCIEGERVCPQEDCGGVIGYEMILEVLENGKYFFGENIDELKEWLGDWKPGEFSVNKINKKLKWMMKL